MKTEKTLRMLKLLSMLQAQAARARKLQGSGARRSAKPKAVDPAQAAELKVAFEFFDKDKSGFIDKSELKLVLGSLGTALSEDDLALLYVEMDPSGDGKIDLGEFTSVMAQAANKPSAPRAPTPTPTSTAAPRGPIAARAWQRRPSRPRSTGLGLEGLALLTPPCISLHPLHPPLAPLGPVEVALAIFSVLDHNNSGHVSASQLKP